MTAPRAISVAILAMGGEGGGVLADWLVDLAEHNGYYAQTTSVPGVAQRTGATIYYVEMFPQAEVDRVGRPPVLSLMPVPGEVDLVVASELMEAGRAIQRGLVTADRTTLILSTHRVYAIGEKIAMGDGRVDDQPLVAAAMAAARVCLPADFARLADETGSLISAPLFGAVAASGQLPFKRELFEAAIKAAGVGVKTSLAAFAVGFDAASQARAAVAVAAPDGSTPLAQISSRAPAASALPPVGPRLQGLASRVARDFPEPARATLIHGLLRLADYQDVDYAAQYLERLAPFAAPAFAAHDAGAAICEALARGTALWMSYEDTARVADLKTRASRFARVAGEVRLAGDQLLQINEFLHPRLEEIADSLPAGFGRWLLRSRWAGSLVRRFTREGRVVRTSSLRGFLLLYCVASLRHLRRGSLRYSVETAQLQQWLTLVHTTAAADPALALEIARCQTLVKGYGDTHERGRRSFDKLMGQVPRLQGQAGGAARLAQLRAAALADEHGIALDRALAA